MARQRIRTRKTSIGRTSPPCETRVSSCIWTSPQSWEPAGPPRGNPPRRVRLVAGQDTDSRLPDRGTVLRGTRQSRAGRIRRSLGQCGRNRQEPSDHQGTRLTLHANLGLRHARCHVGRNGFRHGVPGSLVLAPPCGEPPVHDVRASAGLAIQGHVLRELHDVAAVRPDARELRLCGLGCRKHRPQHPGRPQATAWRTI